MNRREIVCAMTTNSMDGGNGGLKYKLRAACQRGESIEARCLLAALRDSTKTFRNDKPRMSFAVMNSEFVYG
ncbi:MAG: hypothetical protein JRN44_00675 [Nitrososphaerota archaeon]|nr:hypothetical protein [Nitrososphaerota archaeon]MDG6947020.1 hypothetical protein [Nitrososphaerota archaeon]